MNLTEIKSNTQAINGIYNFLSSGGENEINVEFFENLMLLLNGTSAENTLNLQTGEEPVINLQEAEDSVIANLEEGEDPVITNLEEEKEEEEEKDILLSMCVLNNMQNLLQVSQPTELKIEGEAILTIEDEHQEITFKEDIASNPSGVISKENSEVIKEEVYQYKNLYVDNIDSEKKEVVKDNFENAEKYKNLDVVNESKADIKDIVFDLDVEVESNVKELLNRTKEPNKAQELTVQKDTKTPIKKIEHIDKLEFEHIRGYNNYFPVQEIETQDKVITETHILENLDVITEKLVESVTQTETDSMKELKVKLKPEFLGEVEITLKESEGKLTATLKISNEELRDAMQGRTLDIETSLKSQGINIEKIELNSYSSNFDTNNSQKQGNGRSTEDDKRHYLKRDIFTEISTEEEVISAITVNRGRIDYLA